MAPKHSISSSKNSKEKQGTICSGDQNQKEQPGYVMVNNTRDIASCIHGTCAKTVVVSFHSWNKYIVQFAVPLGETLKKKQSSWNYNGKLLIYVFVFFVSLSFCKVAKCRPKICICQKFFDWTFLTNCSWRGWQKKNGISWPRPVFSNDVLPSTWILVWWDVKTDCMKPRSLYSSKSKFANKFKHSIQVCHEVKP